MNDSRRGGDRVTDRDGRGGRPPVLRRATLNLLALLAVGVILYGALLPFEWSAPDGLRWGLDWHAPEVGDGLVNVLIYIPVGALLRLVFRRRGSTSLQEWGLVMLVAAGLCYLTEIHQTVMAERVASWADSLLNLGGAAIGAALAPVAQRIVRNLHAWLYQGLRTRPLAAAAAAATLGICAYGLMPFDPRPSPGQLRQGLMVLGASAASVLSGAGGQLYAELPLAQVLDKLAAAGAFGVLAFLLVLAGREAGRAAAAAVWRALTAGLGLAAGIELLQLFTISHVADLRDLLLAGLAGVFGCGLAWVLTGRWPDLHARPGLVLRGLVAALMLGLVVWAAGRLSVCSAAGAPRLPSWLPLTGSFHRPWNGLLGDCVGWFLQYTLVAGLMVLWYRSRRRGPRPWVVLAVSLGVGSVFMCWGATRPADTLHLLLAGLAALAVLRAEQAIFEPGSHKPVHRSLSGLPQG